ncbi:uncharacterized protein PFL1_06312 [Pseudozyma flocculosa PF-1]|uniref:HTH CENPB-type domain-containing protein n=2 Tax=Pseudozyma flocculosa TaxID=84751 RepID=A0A5C3FAL6_9BASI|nr:uncharacterized protein PFL1_06312 [Pseudozyma flocculosa PF-1]EPQ26104.1 hypothetical protein PFL1_06312 [Pseudozyma flocculosa PF-1]SPO40349.1 uncharacterized protein PSFLO_05831 [Pseudozyma flocculosa]
MGQDQVGDSNAMPRVLPAEAPGNQVQPSSELSIGVQSHSAGEAGARGTTSWHGMDSVEFMQSGGYSTGHQFPTDHAAFLPYTVSEEHSQAGGASQTLGADGNDMAANSELFGSTSAASGFSASHESQLNGALGHKGRFAATSLPTPPDSHRRPHARQVATTDMDVDIAADNVSGHGGSGGDVPASGEGDGNGNGNGDSGAAAIAHGAGGETRRRPLQGLSTNPKGPADGEMADDNEVESPSPLGFIQKRMFMQQGSPTPGQRSLHLGRVGESTNRAGGGGGSRPFLSHRPSQSLGQAGSMMSGGNPGDGSAMRSENLHISAPVSPVEAGSQGTFPAMMPFGPNQQHDTRHAHQAMLGHGHPISPGVLQQSQGQHQDQMHGHRHMASQQEQSRQTSGHSIRSISPSNSIASTAMTSLTSMSGQHGQCSISPLGSARFYPDASFGSQDTSTDSISNAPSTCVSRASSTSDELLSHDFSNGFVPPSLRMSKRKRKLLNIDRKLICDFQLANPDAKQDAIAAKFGIERSTVSKILKQKHKWLAIDPSSEAARIAKHRTAKFPEVEDRLSEWVMRTTAEGKPVHDAMIRSEALRIAKEIGLTLDKFKASGGWIEKFRERNQLPKANTTRDIDASTSASPSGSRLPTPDGDADIDAEADADADADADGDIVCDDGPSRVKGEHVGAGRASRSASAAAASTAAAATAAAVPSHEGSARALTPSASERAAATQHDGHHSVSGQTTPTSSQKRRFEAMASASFAGSDHVSPLNSNLARMQFGQQTNAGQHEGLSPEFVQHMAAQQQQHHHHQHHQPQGGHPSLHFQQSNGSLPPHAAGFFPSRAFVDGAGALHSSQDNPFLLQMQGVGAGPAGAGGDGDDRAGVAAKRRRAGPQAARVESHPVLGPPFGGDRPDPRAVMNAFQFPATPDNKLRLRESSMHSRPVFETPGGSPSPLPQRPHEGAPISPASTDGQTTAAAGKAGSSTGGARKAGQASKPRQRKASTSPVKRSSRRGHVPGASSPLTRSPHGITASIEDEADCGPGISAGESPAGQAQAAPSRSSPLPAGQAAGQEQSIVTAEQAQQSLDLVLRFLGEQSSNFVPSSHFVVFGHLQANIEQLIRDRNGAGGATSSGAQSTAPSSRPISPTAAAVHSEQ